MGNTGTGTLELDGTTSAAVVDKTNTSNVGSEIGYGTGGVGSVTVSGSQAVFNSVTGIHVGYSGTGTLTITDGGAVNTVLITQPSADWVGVAAGSNGTVSISGAGSQYISTNNIFILGGAGNGTLNVTDGGLLSDAQAPVGFQSGGIGVATVSGAGSQWVSSDYL